MRGIIEGEEKEKRREVPRNAQRGSVSASEPGLKHADDGLLIGDDLGLPNQNDGHDAHGEDAEAQNDASLRL